MSDDKLLQYFIDSTNERLDKIEEKLDLLISFRIMLLGAAAVVSTVVALSVQILIR
jgi:hypothetical protein